MFPTCQQADGQPHTDSYNGSNKTEVEVGQRVPVICQQSPLVGEQRGYVRSCISKTKYLLVNVSIIESLSKGKKRFIQ